MNVVIFTANHRESCNSGSIAPLFFFLKNEGFFLIEEEVSFVCIVKQWGAGENNSWQPMIFFLFLTNCLFTMSMILHFLEHDKLESYSM